MDWGLELVTVHGKACARSQAGNGWNSGSRRAIWILEEEQTKGQSSEWRGWDFLLGCSSCSYLTCC